MNKKLLHDYFNNHLDDLVRLASEYAQDYPDNEILSYSDLMTVLAGCDNEPGIYEFFPIIDDNSELKRLFSDYNDNIPDNGLYLEFVDFVTDMSYFPDECKKDYNNATISTFIECLEYITSDTEFYDLDYINNGLNLLKRFKNIQGVKSCK